MLNSPPPSGPAVAGSAATHATGAARVTTVVVHYRNPAATVRCLHAVATQTHPSAAVVVDNAHPDDERGWPDLAREAERFGVSTLDPGCNTGFAGGSNLGIGLALERGDAFIWLVNPDALPPPETLAVLLAAMEREPRLGAASADLGTETAGGDVRLWRGAAPLRRTGRPRWVSGACVLLRAEAVRAAGAFDEALFLYWEDVELCLRLGKAGYVVAVVSGASVRHERGGSVGNHSPAQDYYGSRNPLLVVRKHAPAALVTAAIFVLLRVSFAKLVRGEWRRLGPALAGWRDGLAGRGGPYTSMRKSP